MSIPVPDPNYLAKLGLVVFLIAEIEGQLKNDMVRYHPWLPIELDYGQAGGRSVTGMTTKTLGKYFIAHAPKCTLPGLADYYRTGGEALVEISPKRNAMLHSQPAIDGWDWRVPDTESTRN